MFDDFEFDSPDMSQSISSPGGSGFDTSGLGSWGGGSIGDGSAADLSNWGNQYDGQSLASLFGGEGALASLFGNGSAGSTGYNTDGLGKYGQADPYGTMTHDQAAKIMTDGGAAAPDKQNSMLKALGFKASADGTSTDFTDPKSLSQLMKILGVGGNFLSKLMSSKSAASAQTPNLQAQLAQVPQRTWSPAQQMMADSYFNHGFTPSDQRQKIYASDMKSPIVPGVGYAEGGTVEGPLEAAHGELDRPQGFLPGPTGGQADKVPANLSHGEYVLDADLVAALGDGNNQAGADKLDAWKEQIRTHKRSAPATKIPPAAKSPAQYMKGVK